MAAPDPAPAGTVLVVDDEPFNRDVLVQELGALGHRAVEAADGGEALALLDGSDVDALLLDIMMPGMDGFSVLAALARRPALAVPPVIVISAANEIGNVVRALELGAVDYLPKPFDPVILKARVGQALKERHWRRREAAHMALLEEERRRADGLLEAIMPPPAVAELKQTGRVTPRRVEGVAVLFLDVADFSGIAARETSDSLIRQLSTFVTLADRLTPRHGVERVKVVGDALLLAAGLLAPHPAPVDGLVAAAGAILAGLRQAGLAWQVHGGLSYGTVVTGVVGDTRFAFDLWGDPVNRAARLAAIPGRDAVFLDSLARSALARPVDLAPVGTVALKGIGETATYRATLAPS